MCLLQMRLWGNVEPVVYPGTATSGHRRMSPSSHGKSAQCNLIAWADRPLEERSRLISVPWSRHSGWVGEAGGVSKIMRAVIRWCVCTPMPPFQILTSLVCKFIIITL
jgi:hypothetical protein